MDLYKICAGYGAVSPAEDTSRPVCGASLRNGQTYSLAPKAPAFRVEEARNKEHRQFTKDRT